MLKDILLQDGVRPRVVVDCTHLVDAEVAAKSGLTGLAVKAAYGVVKAIRPGFIESAVDHLLDEFVEHLEVHFGAFAGGSGFAQFLYERRAAVAQSLLGVTDRRAERAEQALVRKSYEKLRPLGQKHVEAAVPGIGRVVEKYLSP